LITEHSIRFVFRRTVVERVKPRLLKTATIVVSMDEALGGIISPIRFDYSIRMRIVTPDSIQDLIRMQMADLQVPSEK